MNASESGKPAYVAENDRETRRLRALVESASPADLVHPLSDSRTVASVLGHLAFWDSRSIWLAEKIERGEPFRPGDAEPEDVEWINAAIARLIDAMPPRDIAEFALRAAEEVDRRVAALRPEQLWPQNPDSLLNAFRAEHRREHLDEIEAVLGTGRT